MERNNKNGESILFLILAALGSFIRRKLDAQENSKPTTPPVKIHRVYRGARTLVEVKRVINVKANPSPYHIERGWKKNGRFHEGYYRCRLRAFKGEIEEGSNGVYKFYIFNPPAEMLNGPHKPCFTPNSRSGNGNRFHIHFGVNSNDLDGGIMAVERLLTESLSRR